MTGLPRGQGAPIMVHLLLRQHPRLRPVAGEWVMVRSGLGWRDMHGDQWPDTAILDWSPLIEGEREGPWSR